MHDGNLQVLLQAVGLSNVRPADLEVLGEKALPEGHIDLLLKQRVPLGSTFKVPIEVKTNKGLPKDLVQLQSYHDELSGESPIGILIASDFHKAVVTLAAANQVKLVRYSLSADLTKAATFEEIYLGLKLDALSC